MANKLAWVAGAGQGLTWGTLINSSDLASMSNGSSVLSSVADITNGTALDLFMDVSVRCAIASSTIAAGASISMYLYALLDDGSTYGDGQLTAGTQAAKTPAVPPCAVIPLYAAASQTTLVGFSQGIIIPPGSFRVALQNNSGFAFTSGTQTVKYRTYTQNLNA